MRSHQTSQLQSVLSGCVVVVFNPPHPILLQIITSILTEQRVVFVSLDWARLTLVAECFMRFIHPLHWQHPFVPILSHQMLDFLMAPTSYLMGCHAHHIEEVLAVCASFSVAADL